MPVYKKGKSNSRVSKSAKKGKFKLKKWMIFTGIGVIALVGFIVLRYSFASIDLPECSPEPTLVENAKALPSDCVTNLQIKLNTVMGTKLAENGKYDEKVAKVVKDFQQKYAVPIERNKVGPKTWAKLNAEFDKKTNGQEVGSYKVAILEASNGSKVQANACLSLTKANTEEVRIWYKKILKDGSTTLAPYDGYYIAASDQTNPQVLYGNSWNDETNESTKAPATAVLSYPDASWGKYSAGTNNYKFYVGIGYNVSAYTASATAKTVDDGIVKNGGQALDVKALNLCRDSKTLAIQKPANKPKITLKTTKSTETKPVATTPPPPPAPSPNPAPTPTPPPIDFSFLNYPGHSLQQGSNEGSVKVLQVLLCMDRANIADGNFGPQTDAEVRRYQQINGLQVDGIVGPITWGKLISDDPGYKPLCNGEGLVNIGTGNGPGAPQKAVCEVSWRTWDIFPFSTFFNIERWPATEQECQGIQAYIRGLGGMDVQGRMRPITDFLQIY